MTCRACLTFSVSVWTVEAALDRVAARGHQLAAARRVDLDQADAARAVGQQAAVVAERGDRDAHLPRRAIDRRAPGHLRRAAVYAQQDSIRCSCVHNHPSRLSLNAHRPLPTGRGSGTRRRNSACEAGGFRTPRGNGPRWSTPRWAPCYPSRTPRRSERSWPAAPRLARSAGSALALADAVQDAGKLLGPFAAGNALAARLVEEEADQKPRHVDHAGALVQHDDSRRCRS